MAQRSVLFFDVMRQRGNQYQERMAESALHVLECHELLIAIRGAAAGNRPAMSASWVRAALSD